MCLFHVSYCGQKLVEQLIRQHFKGDKTKINAKAVAAVCELLRLFVAGVFP
jgi:hypothetical protein